MAIESDNSLPTEYTEWSAIQKGKIAFSVFSCVSWDNYWQSSHIRI